MVSLEKEKLASRVFDVHQSTLYFVLLSLISLGFIYWYWLVVLVKKLNRYDANISIALPIAAASLSAWSAMMYSSVETTPLGVLLSLVEIIILVALSFKIRYPLEKIFQSQNMPYKMSSVWTFFLPGYYQYYIITNIEEIYSRRVTSAAANEGRQKSESSLEKLERLAQLRQNGTITEEEFQQYKNKILHE